MTKNKWHKIPPPYVYNVKGKEELFYRGFKLVIVNEGKARWYSRDKFNWCWYGYVYDSNDIIVPTALKQLNRYKLSESVTQSRDMMVKYIDDNWYHYSGEKAKDDEIKKQEELLLTKRKYVMQNIHRYAEFFPSNLEINAETLWSIVKFALDNFDDFEALFKAKTQLAEVLLEHYRNQDKWLSLSPICRQRELFSHVKADTISRLVHDYSSYWGYDEKYWIQEPTTRNVYVNNPNYVAEPVFPFDETRTQERIIQELSGKLRQLARKINFNMVV
jgi:hypothetical protein